jgi:hypothetical protein
MDRRRFVCGPMTAPKETALTNPIIAFIVVGILFGLATYSRRHLFSEGPTRRTDEANGDALDGRVMWVMISTALWPILMLTGIYSLVRMSRVRARASRHNP